jgi:hypothetical protein
VPSFDVREVPFGRYGSFFTGSFLPVISGRTEGLYLRYAHGRALVLHLEGPDCGVELCTTAAHGGRNIRALSDVGSLVRPMIDPAAHLIRWTWGDMA